MADNLSGELHEIDESQYGRTAPRAIVDIGLLDINPDFLIPDDSAISVVGGSSDMMVLDLGGLENSYAVGDLIDFKMKYISALQIMNSRYIGKTLIN